MNFPSVTQAAWPIDWSKIPPGNLQYAADRGTKVHNYCTRHALKDFVIVNDPDCVNYFASFTKWFSLMVKEVVYAEERLVDTVWNYSGQIDLLVILHEANKLALVDLKTPIMARTSWKVQLAGYHNLCVKDGKPPDCTGSLQLSPQGKMAKMTWYQETAADFNQFLMELQCYRYHN